MSNINFSVFPPSHVPRISIPNPNNRKPSLKTVNTEDNLKESVVIALQEIPSTRIAQEQRRQGRPSNQSSEVQLGASFSVIKNGMPPPPPLPQAYIGSRRTTTTNRANTNQGSPDPSTISSSDTLISESHEEEAVVPIRSMFPVYDPSVPLTQQPYHPQRPAAAQLSDSFRSSTRTFPPNSVRGSVASRNNQFSVVDVPLDVLNFRQPTFSSSKELEKLWDAASNSEPIQSLPSFDLEMGRPEEALFTFGSSIDAPFYTVTTYDTSEISLTKTCPKKDTLVCDVLLSTIESPSRRLPPGDGLISYIFPKTAAMLAANQSEAFAQDYDLSPTDRRELEEAAVQRAAAQEASHLRWNPVENHYVLEHPAITRKNRDIDFTESPMSPQGSKKPALIISVATSDQSVQDRPVILVTCPASLRSPPAYSEERIDSPATAEPLTELHLASLDFNTNTLHIEAKSILEIMPSPFAIDSIVSALVSVSVADYDANSAMGDMKIQKREFSAANRISETVSQPSIGSPKPEAFYTTIAEREEAEEEARAAAKKQKKGPKFNFGTARSADQPEQVDLEAGRTWYGKSKVKKPRQKKQIVIGEFDLEKLTHYQSGARQGQELPAVTRGALTMMVNSLKFVVWLLTMIVQFLAWIMVSLTRGVTSEKF